jgi:heme-degrading monooxygenase HmoA
MFVAIFEVHPRAERFDDYLALAKRLRPALEEIDGFVDNERFRSTRRPGWILSLSTWRDEKSIVRWRTTGVHHIAQKQGRAEILEDYHLRIGDVTADSGAPGKAPVHEQRFDETEIGAKFATVTELTPERDAALGRIDVISSLGLDTSREGLVNYDVCESIYNPGKLALLVLWKEANSAGSWMPEKPFGFQMLRHRRVRIVRDYSMFDRREAPQFFSDAKGQETKRPDRPKPAAIR